MDSARTIPPAELMLRDNGATFHLGLLPEQLEERIILVGDPDRVGLVAEHLEGADEVAKAREFRTARGAYRGIPIMVQSTGIGSGNIDIVLNELDALANIDLTNRTIRKAHRALQMVRIGTSGSLSAEVSNGEAIVSHASVGLDPLPSLYELPTQAVDWTLGRAFAQHMDLSYPTPYGVWANEQLATALTASLKAHAGITLCAPGFYGPQGRHLRLKPALANLTKRAATFAHRSFSLLNIEMESAPLHLLARALGHHAATVTLAIDNRALNNTHVDHQARMHSLIEDALSVLAAAKPQDTQ